VLWVRLGLLDLFSHQTIIVRPFLFTYPISRKRKPVIGKTAHQFIQQFYAHCREYLWWPNNKLAANPCDIYPRTDVGLKVHSAHHILNFSNSLRCAMKDVFIGRGSSKPKNTTSRTSLTYEGLKPNSNCNTLNNMSGPRPTAELKSRDRQDAWPHTKESVMWPVRQTR